MRAAGYGTAADGLMQTLPPEAKTLLSNLGQTVVSQMTVKQGGNGKTDGGVTKADAAATADELHRG